MDAPFPDGMVEEIAQLLAIDSDRGVGLDSYDFVFGSKFFFPLQRRRELESMMRIARVIKPKTIMEIGADKGGSLYHWCKCLPTVDTVIACEIRGLPYAESFNEAFPHIMFKWHPEPSADARVWLRVSQDKKEIDCLFIDGDKLRFLDDFTCYLPMMARGGIIFMHDVTDRGGPQEAFQYIVAHQTKYGVASVDVVIDRSESVEAVKRERQGIPATCPHEEWLRHWKGKSCGIGIIRLEK